MAKRNNTLTQKQENFCLSYLETGNASEAYRRAYDAGKMKKTTVWRKAHEVLENGKVRARIEGLRTTAAEKVVIDKAWVLEHLVENVERAMQLKPATDREGKAIGGVTYNGGVANRALELLGKEIGMFVNRRLLGVKHVDDMTEEELLVFLGGEPDPEDLRQAARRSASQSQRQS